MAVAVLSGYVTLGKLAGVADPFDPVAVPVGGPVRDVDGAIPTPKPLQDVRGQEKVGLEKGTLDSRLLLFEPEKCPSSFFQIHSLLVAGRLPSFICAHCRCLTSVCCRPRRGGHVARNHRRQPHQPPAVDARHALVDCPSGGCWREDHKAVRHDLSAC